jgi:nicotinamidase-related amidase
VIREVEQGSTDYMPEQHQHAQDIVQELKPAAVDAYVVSVKEASSALQDTSMDELMQRARG